MDGIIALNHTPLFQVLGGIAWRRLSYILSKGNARTGFVDAQDKHYIASTLNKVIIFTHYTHAHKHTVTWQGNYFVPEKNAARNESKPWENGSMRFLNDHILPYEHIHA